MTRAPVEVGLTSADGDPAGALCIAALPGRTEDPLDRTARGARLSHEPAIAIVEAATYRYELKVDGTIVGIEPSEVFDPDDRTFRTGRLRPQQFVGEIRIQVQVAVDGQDKQLSGRFDVQSAKFEDADAFHSMLTDLADRAVEVLHQGFAPSAGRFASGSGPAPELLYQQFALLHSRLFSPELVWAVRRVQAEPYESWRTYADRRPPGAPAKGSSRLARSIVKPGLRRAIAGHPRLTSVPVQIEVDHSERSLDNPPNRFLRFVFERWRALALATGDAIDVASLTPSQALRGRREVARVVDYLDETLGSGALREAGTLTSFPAGNQVLLKRDGYRQIVAAAALVEATVGLDLGVEDPLVVSRRNVATLYEYWCFVRLAHAVDRVCGGEQMSQLFESTAGGMALRLKRSDEAQARCVATVAGQQIDIAVFYNKSFGKGPSEGQSWTTVLRPDASVRIATHRGASSGPVEHWLHFDAKYRVVAERPDGSQIDLELTMKEASPAAGFTKELSLKGVRASDVVKMHAYRDGIRSSAAAYVLYPGDQEQRFLFAEETLPAVGVMPLRPHLIDHDGLKLETLIREVLEHAANESTRHERATFWARRSYLGRSAPSSTSPPTDANTPPADLKVLLGYVRSPAQRLWIERRNEYNVRSGSRRGALAAGSGDLDVELLVLYGGASWQGPPILVRPRSGWELVDRADMVRRGYPKPNGDAYLCCSWTHVEFQPEWLGRAIRDLLAREDPLRGAPFATTWLDLALAADAPDG